MKFAVIGDLHLGFQFGTERGEDSFKNAKCALDKSIGCDLVILMGDIFHDKIPKPEVMSRAIELFKSVKTPILTIYGTHERRQADSINPVQLLAKIGLLKLIHKECIQFGELAIHGLSGVPDNQARDEMKAWSPKPICGAFNILLLHQSFKEVIPEIPDDILTYADLPSGFQLILDGHIHWRQEDSSNGVPIVFTGSTVITQMKKLESTQSKGILLFEVVNNAIKNKTFVEVPQRPFYYIDLDVAGLKPSDAVNETIKKVDGNLKLGEKPQIKVKLKGELAEGFLATDIYTSQLEKRYAEKCFLSIDKTKVISSVMSEKAKLLLDLKTKQASIEDIGIDLLCQQLPKIDKAVVREWFEKLSELKS